MNTMISLAPRAEQQTSWFTTQRVINRMEAAASAINAVIALSAVYTPRTARIMRTGSSRSRTLGSPIMRSSR